MEKNGNHLLQLENEKWYVHSQIPLHCQCLTYHQEKQSITPNMVPLNLERAMMYHIKPFSGEINYLIQDILQGQAVAVSDGSFMEQSGAAVWTIKGKSAQHQITGEGLTPGDTQDQGAFRCKFLACGVLCSL